MKMDKYYIPLLIDAVKEASEAILNIYNSNFDVEIKPDNSPVTLADKTSSKILVRYLKETNIPIISEEEEKLAYSKRKQLEKLWLVDPIDGTKEFVKRSGQFCICIALVELGKPIFGMIVDPINQLVLFGGKDLGAYCAPLTSENVMAKKYRVVQ
ncbi:MAG: inositol monophosphatase family protein, partial [Putridiphycobacter sp.]|nr:inositol monophosphatase family protein [Putridiphycobacter sp.]